MPESHPLNGSDPRQLGPYRLLGRLGRGGMGTVYLGEDEGGRRVAVKVINPELAQEEPFRARFVREVTAARRVRPFCTAPVLDADLTGDPLYVVTEFIDGPTLDRAVREGGPLTGSNLDALAVGTATALSAIHGAGLVHRDLKPSNVLISPYGPRVIDFGIARALDATSTTRTGQLVGTPAYMAPELMRGGELTPAADVFSWGCVLAFAASGRPAFPGSTVEEILFRVVSDPPRLDGLTAPLRELVEQATAKDPAHRPSAGDLLARLTGGRDTAAAARTVADHATPPLSPPAPPPVQPGHAAMTAPVAAPAAPTVADRRNGRRARLLAIGGTVVAVALIAAVATVLTRGGEPGDGADFEPRETLVTDDFEDAKSGWFEGIGDRTYVNGVYRLHTTLSEQAQFMPVPQGKGIPARMLLDVKARITQGGSDAEAGVFCRNGYGGGKYTLGLRPDGVARIRRTEAAGRSRQLARSDGPVGEPGKANRIQATCEEGGKKMKLALWVNGERVASAEDSSPLKSMSNRTSTGLYVDPRDGGDVTAEFDDFAMSDLG